MKFEKITNVRLPFDRRSPDPKTNYGIHGLDVWFILKGPKGATQFAVTGFDVGYHSLEPQYEGQTKMECTMFGECYYDGSSLRADDWSKNMKNYVLPILRL